MRDALGPNTALCYCTNVHPGTTLDAVRKNLLLHAVPVRDAVAGSGTLGIGLWLAHDAARALRYDAHELSAFAAWLTEHRLEVVTLNGFPHANFHEPVVKHRVYKPAWDEPERLRYTTDLAWILAELLPEGGSGTISTLPLGWREWLTAERMAKCATALREAASMFEQIAQQTGRTITLGLEPEPGCVLDTAADVVGFFERYLDDATRRWIGVCHDMCHAAVMYEEQDAVLRAYRDAGIRVDKVQVSSAIDSPLTREAIDELRRFAEPRYLHQVCIGDADGRRVAFLEDLPELLALDDLASCGQSCRVHFHVPLFLARIGVLGTTQGEVLPAMRAARDLHGTRCFEVETYAWSVLPEAMRPNNLASGIAQELQWLIDACAETTP